MKKAIFPILGLSLLVIAGGLSPARAAQDKPVSYKEEVAPLIKKYCGGCHGDQNPRPAARLVLTTKQGIEKGGMSGKIIKDKTSKESLLVIRMRGEGNKQIMPPGRGEKPKKEQVDLVARWIDEGAKFDIE
ncbi:MAG: hypothetical protein KDC26_06735 [Armatimonadetes bacterium]|nr:hypothetical protein [Armatimonadota bacterium]